MKKRLLSTILTLTLLVGLLAGVATVPANAAQHAVWPEMTGVLSARYSLNGGQVTRLEVGDVFQLEFWLNGIDPYAITIPVNWDPEVVTMVDDTTGKPVSSGLKTERDLGSGFRVGSACYDRSYGDDWMPLYWNGLMVFSSNKDTSDGYPYVDNEHGHSHFFFYVSAPTTPAQPQLFLSLSFQVLKQGDPNFHFATSREPYYDPAAVDGLMLAFKEDGVVASKLQIPPVYIISSWQESTPIPDDPGIGLPWDINADAPKEGEDMPERPARPGIYEPGRTDPISSRPADLVLTYAKHDIAFPYKQPVYTQAVIRTTTSTQPQQSDNYIIPPSYLAYAINTLLDSTAYSSIVVQMPEEYILKDDYIISFSCMNLDDLVDQRAAMLYFETPYGYVGVDVASLLYETGESATVTLGISPVQGGIKLTVQVDGETVSGFSSPVFLLILPYTGEDDPRVVSSTVFGKSSESIGTLPLSIAHHFQDGRTVSFLTPSAGTYVIEAAQAQTFTDVPDSFWGYPAITALSKAGIVNGKTETTYEPDGLVTRAELAKLITCTLSTYQTDFKLWFADVQQDAWYYPYVGSAYRVGIIKGFSKTEFQPKKNVTRQDMAVMAYRGLSLLGVSLTPQRDAPEFSDADQIADYAREAVTALYQAGILNGMSDGSFSPQGTATRAQAAQLMYGLYEIVSKLV